MRDEMRMQGGGNASRPTLFLEKEAGWFEGLDPRWKSSGPPWLILEATA
jgi:hypothetical protein